MRTPEGGTVIFSASPVGRGRAASETCHPIADSRVALALVVVALLGYGLLVVWSAIQTNENYSFSRQLMGVAMGVVAMLICYSFDYRRLANYTTFLLIVNVVLDFVAALCPSLASRAKARKAGSKSAFSCSRANSRKSP